MHTRNGVDICGSQRNPAAIDRKGFVVKKNSVDIWLSRKMLAALDSRRRTSDAPESARAVEA